MKKIVSISLSLTLGMALLFSCKKNEPKVLIDANATPSVLSATPSTVTTDSLQDDATALTFNWTNTNYGYDAANKYTLEIAKEGTEWGGAESKSFEMEREISSKHTNLDLNNIAIAWGFDTVSGGEIMARVKSSVVNTKLAPVYSNVVKVKILPYTKALPPAAKKLYVPGDYQGWNPATAPDIESASGDGVYTGLVDMIKPGGAGSGEFKFTDKQSWDGPNYGAGAGADDLSIDSGAGNLSLAEEGTYRFTVNTNTLKWSYEKRNWGLIGSATPDGWNSDQNMQFDNATKKYVITVDLVAGEIKFRVNDDWGENLGDDGNDGALENNGANIPVAVDGNYTISLDADGKAYTITKN